jgi:hypothetical protein
MYYNELTLMYFVPENIQIQHGNENTIYYVT